MHSPRILPTAASLPSAVTRVRRNLSARYATAPVYVCRRLDLCVRIAVTGSGSGHCVHGVCTVVIGLRPRGSKSKRTPNITEASMVAHKGSNLGPADETGVRFQPMNGVKLLRSRAQTALGPRKPLNFLNFSGTRKPRRFGGTGWWS